MCDQLSENLKLLGHLVIWVKNIYYDEIMAKIKLCLVPLK